MGGTRTGDSGRSTVLPETELPLQASSGLDEMSVLEVLRLLNEEDRRAVGAAGAALGSLAGLVETAIARVRAGGHVHYFGAGTSGRLGVLDAAELVPTFGVDPIIVQAHIAGGERAITHAVEGSEDSEEDGRGDAALFARSGDVVIGLTVSGTTAYVRGALEEARSRGCPTGLITSNPKSPLAEYCDHVIVIDTGREVLTGSTRLKAGTATKIMLNGFSTALMVGLGRTYSNLMVAVTATNHKLRERTLRILQQIAGGGRDDNERLLHEANGDLRVAVVAALSGAAPTRAATALAEADGSVRSAVEQLTLEARG
ncbi:N-acetylmuramic acid 6-phosphate etherase [soil metagenome]